MFCIVLEELQRQRGRGREETGLPCTGSLPQISAVARGQTGSRRQELAFVSPTWITGATTWAFLCACPGDLSRGATRGPVLPQPVFLWDAGVAMVALPMNVPTPFPHFFLKPNAICCLNVPQCFP